jgi:hypothetical protein
MLSARYQADAPVEVSIKEQIGYMEIPSADLVIHVGISISNLRLLSRAISDALNEHDIGQRNVVAIRRRVDKG